MMHLSLLLPFQLLNHLQTSFNLCMIDFKRTLILILKAIKHLSFILSHFLLSAAPPPLLIDVVTILRQATLIRNALTLPVALQSGLWLIL